MRIKANFIKTLRVMHSRFSGIRWKFSLNFDAKYNFLMILNHNIPASLSQLIEKVQENELYVKALEVFQDKYNIHGTNVNFLTPEKVQQTYLKIKKKFYYQRKSPANCSWFQNQLKIYIWVLMCYLYIYEKQIQSMTIDDWSFFKPLFYNRDAIIFEFQGILLLKNKTSRWQQGQIQLLDKIVKIKTEKNKWNSVARQLYILSEKKFIKTPKQCRQRWLNYLDPSKVHSSWTSQEDFILLSSIRDNGKRWAYTVRKLLKKRTEHMVKNRFNSLINNQKKKIGTKSESELLASAIQTASLSVHSELEVKEELVERLQKQEKSQMQEEDFESLFVIKNKKRSRKQTSNVNKSIGSKENMSFLTTLVQLPSQVSLEKTVQVPAEINMSKLYDENYSLSFFEQNVSVIAFNPFQDFSPNGSLIVPDFFNDHSELYLQKQKGDELQQDYQMGIEQGYNFY